MPRSILSQRDQWPDRYADNNLITAPDEVISPVESQNDDAFSDADVGSTSPHRRNVMEDEAMVQWMQQHGQGGGGGSSAPGGGGAGSSGSAPGGSGGAGGSGANDSGLNYTPGSGAYSGGSVSDYITQRGKELGLNPTEIGMAQAVREHEGLGPTGNPSMGFGPEAKGAGFNFDSNPNGAVDQYYRQYMDRMPKDLNRSDPNAIADYIHHTVHNAADPNYTSELLNTYKGPVGGATTPGAANAGTSSAGGSNLGTPAAPAGQMRNVNPSHGQGPTTGPDTHGALLPDTQAFKDSFEKQFPGATTSIGGWREDSFQEHPSGHALDLMIPDKATQDKVRPWILQQPNVNYVLNQNKQWNPDGSSSTGISSPHNDHIHVNVAGDYQPDPSATPPTTPVTPSTATTPVTQPTQPTDPASTPTPAAQPAVQQPPPTQQPPPPMTLARKRRAKRRSAEFTETLF